MYNSDARERRQVGCRTGGKFLFILDCYDASSVPNEFSDYRSVVALPPLRYALRSRLHEADREK